MIRTLIVEDSPASAAALSQDIEDYCPEIELIGIAPNVIEAAKMIRSEKPQLLFLDIDLGDGSGFDLLEILGEEKPAVIFTTSSNEHAIRAFEFSAIHYLLKPVDPMLLQEAVKRVESTQEPQIDQLKAHLGGDSGKITLNSQEKIRVVEINSIVRCESTGAYTFFHTNEGEEILVTRTLKEYDRILGEKGFLRVHQSHLVNLSYVKEFVKSDGGYLVLKNGQDIPVSSRKKSSVLAALGGL
jgi:two-component system LytT family response regulator